MTEVTYEIVEHDGGWAYKVDGAFSEPFPTHADALAAAQAAAAEQEEPGHTEQIEYEDEKGQWHTETARGNDRPALVIGFAAETENIVANARVKRAKKGCDWILANDVAPGTGTFGGDRNTIHLVDGDGVEDWPAMTKREVATRLAERIAAKLAAP